MNEIAIQPELPRGRTPGKPVYALGAKRSVARLKALGYDPIGSLVEKYNDLEDELKRQKKIRSNELVELTASGKPRAYNPETTMSIYEKQIAIAEKLLRYGYGRVPENTLETPKTVRPMIVNLTKKGETYVVNDIPDEDFAHEDDETDLFEQSSRD
jgi:hypothetical protein